MTKRHFLKLAALGGGVLAGLGRIPLATAKVVDGIPYRTFGSTGVQISAIGLGGFHIGNPKEDEGIAIIRSALDRGINFLDNCWDYHEGDSEVRMGKALRDGYRDKAFLMSKIDGRTAASCAKQIDESLKRLQTDRIDLMQFHEIIRPEDVDRIFADGGALEAMLAAQKAGKVRYIGFTGHKNPDYHMKMLLAAAQHKLHFDAVQMPLNVMDAHFESFEKKVLPWLQKQNIAVLGMKPFGGGYILKAKEVTPLECLHYAMNLPTATVITGCDSLKILDQAVEAGKTFQPMTQEQVAALLARTAKLAEKGKYEHYKMNERFDGTAKNPEWLG